MRRLPRVDIICLRMQNNFGRHIVSPFRTGDTVQIEDWVLFHTLQWRHNERDGVSNHQQLHRWLNCWFRRRSKKTSKLHVTGLCPWNLPLTGELPAQKASDTKIFPFGGVIMTTKWAHNTNLVRIHNALVSNYTVDQLTILHMSR